MLYFLDSVFYFWCRAYLFTNDRRSLFGPPQRTAVQAAQSRLRDRFRPGVLFALWLVLSGVERILIEFIRRNERVALGLTLAQLLSIVMLAAGAVWLARAERPFLRPAAS